MNPANLEYAMGKLISPPHTTAQEIRDACHTLSGMPARDPELTTRIRYVANLLEAAGKLPSGPVLLWRDSDQSVRHVPIKEPFVVGRAPECPGLAVPEDRILSRSHFSINFTEEGWRLLNLNAKNGIAVNCADDKVTGHLLRDGDLIFAGNQIFAFLDEERAPND